MITASADVTIHRRIEDVFAFLTDASNHRRWDSTSIEMVPEQPGPWREGLEFREVRRIGPRATEVRSRIASFEDGRSMDLESLTGPTFRGHWRLADVDGATRLRWTGELEPTGLSRILAPVIQGQFRRTTAANFARLKAVLEQP
jgi:polyketide cyclase/dehydrase/lipid transport protein